MPRVTEQCDAVINITTGGASSMTMDERLAGAQSTSSPRSRRMNMGSMNFVYSGIADKVTEWKHDWEKPYVREDLLPPVRQHLRPHRGDPAHPRRHGHPLRVRVLRHRPPLLPRPLRRPRPRDRPPLLIQGVFGVLGRHRRRPREPRAHGADRRQALRRRLPLLGLRRRSRPAAVRHPQRVARAATCGSGSRTASGSARASSPRATPSRCTKIRGIVEDLGREIATPDEARAMLDLKGAPARVAVTA